MSFLTAEWRKLAMANYAVPDTLLLPHLPPGTELDKWAGSAYASLIGFQFLNVRVLGVRVPLHVNFEEVNLRFYVRHLHEGTWRRGVVFLRELVPLPAITLVANTLYHEHYRTTRMRHRVEEEQGRLRAEYEWKNKGTWQRFGVTAPARGRPLTPGGTEEFITQHFYGYTKTGPRTTVEYEVTHPAWETYPVAHYDIDVDFAANYGEAFGFLTGRAPESVLLAEGSAITIEGKRRIRT